MVNPQKHNLIGLFSLFHLMNPTSMDYLMGKPDYYLCNNTWTKDLIEDHTIRINAPPPYVEGVNLIIYWDLLDVWCLVDRRSLTSFINSITMYIDGIPVLPETHIGALSLSCRERSKWYRLVKFLQFIFKQKTERCKSFPVSVCLRNDLLNCVCLFLLSLSRICHLLP